MAADILGKEVSSALSGKIRQKVELLEQMGITPTLRIIRVGDNPGDLSYEKGAGKRCAALGILVQNLVFPGDVSQAELLAAVHAANEDPSVHGVLLFRPLPVHLDREEIENALLPEKDVDGMTDLSMSGVFTGKEIGYPPCTAQACMEILDFCKEDLCGKRAVVIGRSNVIGKPVSMLLLRKHATVTVCHTRTRDLAAEARRADILVAAAGRAKMIGEEFVSPGQLILDVGINVDEDGRLCGDVDYEAVSGTVGRITPVPGGVGAVTTTVLALHVVQAALRQNSGK
jgi:methylenetetrahydrofolate dehydrogenase (NADP+)/methenyltetrahydrofolate cyclohydrolase